MHSRPKVLFCTNYEEGGPCLAKPRLASPCQVSGPSTTILVSAEERWSRRECLEIAAERGWHFAQLGGERRPDAAQLACVDQRSREMGDGPCFVYVVTRKSGGAASRSAGR